MNDIPDMLPRAADDFITLLGDASQASRDRSRLLCAMAAVGREAPFDSVADAMAKVSWDFEMVQAVAQDLVDGGAVVAVRNQAGILIGWRVTSAAATHLAMAIVCGCTVAERATAPEWLRPFIDAAVRFVGSHRGAA